MDKEFIKKNNLDETIHRLQELAGYNYPKQSLKHLYEYVMFSNGVNEEGENDGELQQPQNNGMGQQQGQNGAPDAPMQGGGMNGQMGGQMPPDGAGMPQNGNMMQGGGEMPNDNNMDMGNAPMGPAPMGNDMQGGEMGMEDPMMGGNDDMGDEMPNDDMGMGDEQVPEQDIETTEMEPDDEVIDVDDLTQSQEATEYKIDGVDDRLTKIYAVVKKFSDQLEKQEQSILKLKDEFERRNPTQTEKFNLRSQASGPFNQTPTEYWDKLTQENPHYDIMRNNDVSPSEEQKQYEIKRGDISGLNMKNISDTLNIDQNLKNYIGF